jgi:hypothetical protein
LSKFCISAKGGFAILEHQNSSIEKLASSDACVGFTAQALIFVDNHFDCPLFKMHVCPPPVPGQNIMVWYVIPAQAGIQGREKDWIPASLPTGRQAQE